MGYRPEKNGEVEEVDIHDHPVGLYTRIASVFILTILHAMTFADRYCIAGALGKVTDFYQIDDSQAGLIQTLFLAASIVGSPFAGYFGDRYNRKMLMSIGCVIWICVMVASSFIPGNQFWLFMLLRCLDGFSENVVYACAPSLIADYFSGQARSYAFMFFYYAINVGCAFGAMLGAVIASSTQWQWALRFVPAVTIVGWLGVVFILEEPPRGAADKEKVENTGSYWEDLKYLAGVKTFVLMCLGCAAVNITAGSQGWWNALIVYHSMKRDENDTLSEGHVFHHETYGLINTISGFVGIVCSVSGVSFVVYWTEKWKAGEGIFRKIKTVRAPALVIAISLTIACPFTYMQQPFVLWSIYGYYICAGVSTFFTGSSWVLSIDVAYAVTSANRRSTTVAVLTLIQHLLGDGPGPYIAGLISDSYRGSDDTHYGHMWSLLRAFFIINGCTVLAFAFFYLVAFFMKEDHLKNLREEDVARNDQIEKQKTNGFKPRISIPTLPAVSVFDDSQSQSTVLFKESPRNTLTAVDDDTVYESLRY